MFWRPQLIEDLIRKNRSYRRFEKSYAIEEGTLKELVNLARLSPSAGNAQPLKYMLSANAERNKLIFPTLRWAAYLQGWPGPAEGERPSAYIIVLGDTEISKNFLCDHGIACQSMLLGAVEKGLGGCLVGSIDREQLREALSIPERYEILLVVALGKPKEKVVIETADPDGDIRYYRDADQVHHVPKRPLEEMILDKS